MRDLCAVCAPRDIKNRSLSVSLMSTSALEFLFIVYFNLKKLIGGLFVSIWRMGYNWANVHFGSLVDDYPFLNYGYKEGAVKENKCIDDVLLAKKDKMKEILPADFQKVWGSTQLYAATLSLYRGDISGKSILEVGCGRGGGCSVVHAYCKPSQYMGVDLSNEAISLCKKLHKNEDNRNFKVANSMELANNFPRGSFDVVLNVESAHCYPSIEKFANGVYHVLKPNGQFLFADLGAKVEFDVIRETFEKAGLSVVAEYDVTRNVTRSLRDELAPHLLKMIWNRGSIWQYPWLWFVANMMVSAPQKLPRRWLWCIQNVCLSENLNANYAVRYVDDD